MPAGRAGGGRPRARALEAPPPGRGVVGVRLGGASRRGIARVVARARGPGASVPPRRQLEDGGGGDARGPPRARASVRDARSDRRARLRRRRRGVRLAAPAPPRGRPRRVPRHLRLHRRRARGRRPRDAPPRRRAREPPAVLRPPRRARTRPPRPRPRTSRREDDPRGRVVRDDDDAPLPLAPNLPPDRIIPSRQKSPGARRASPRVDERPGRLPLDALAHELRVSLLRERVRRRARRGRARARGARRRRLALRRRRRRRRRFSRRASRRGRRGVHLGAGNDDHPAGLKRRARRPTRRRARARVRLVAAPPRPRGDVRVPGRSVRAVRRMARPGRRPRSEWGAPRRRRKRKRKRGGSNDRGASSSYWYPSSPPSPTLPLGRERRGVCEGPGRSARGERPGRVRAGAERGSEGGGELRAAEGVQGDAAAPRRRRLPGGRR